MSRRPVSSSRGAVRGMTLIEVLVALLVFSFGLLGLLGLQARAVQFSTSAEDTNRAALLANELASIIITSGTATLPAATVTAWQTRVANAAGDGLPNGAGQVAVANNVATITIEWRAASAKSTAPVNRYVTQLVGPVAPVLVP